MNQLFNKGVPFYDNGIDVGGSFSSLDLEWGAVKKNFFWFILYILLKRKIETDMTLFT